MTTAKTFDRQTGKFLAVVAENMPELAGGEMQYYIEHPTSVQKLLKVFAAPKSGTEFPTWKTVKLGTHHSVHQLSQALTDSGFRIGDYAAQILKKTPLAETETEIELVLVAVADLGFSKATRRDAIYDRAKELGLDLAPSEVGPQLRLQYADQPMNEWVLMAMEPLTVPLGGLFVFGVVHYDDGRWLYSYYGNPDFMWYPVNHWVFARRKQN